MDKYVNIKNDLMLAFQVFRMWKQFIVCTIACDQWGDTQHSSNFRVGIWLSTTWKAEKQTGISWILSKGGYDFCVTVIDTPGPLNSINKKEVLIKAHWNSRSDYFNCNYIKVRTCISANIHYAECESVKSQISGCTLFSCFFKPTEIKATEKYLTKYLTN